MLAQSTSWKRRQASITAKGFWAVAALSRYTRGLPWMFCLRTGKSWRIFSTSKPAVAPVETGLLSVLMKFLEKNPFQRIAQRLYFDAIHHVLRESVSQQAAGLAFADAARLQVEERFAVELADGGAMGAAHIVGEDLQLGFGIHHGVVGEDQVLVSLLGIGLLGVLADDDFAVEDGVCLAVEDALVELVAGAVRHGVVDHRMIIDVLRAVDDVEAVQRGVGTFGEGGVDVVADQRAAEGNGMRGECGAASDGGSEGRNMEGVDGFLLDFVMIHHGAIANDDFGDGVGEVSAGALVRLNDGALRVGADQDQDAGVGHRGAGTRACATVAHPRILIL